MLSADYYIASDGPILFDIPEVFFHNYSILLLMKKKEIEMLI